MSLDPVTLSLSLLGGGLSAAEAIGEGAANRANAKAVREAGRLDRISLGLKRAEDIKSLGRAAAQEQG